MFRRILASAALAAGFALGGSAAAGGDTVQLGRYKPVPGGVAGAVKSAADDEAAKDTAGDTELVHGYRGGYRGHYHGGYYGYRGGYYGHYRGYSSFAIGIGLGWPGYYGGFGYGWGGYGWGWPRYSIGIGLGWPWYGYGYSSYYWPGYAVSVYSAPRVYYPAYSYGYSYYPGDLCLTGGTVASTYAPSVSLGATTASGPTTVPTAMPGNGTTTAQRLPPPTPVGQRVPQALPAPTPSGTFQYDGGPATPVPMPATDPPKTIEPAGDQPAASVSISLPARKPAHKYPAYGDKK
jgi:hypothetical protein